MRPSTRWPPSLRPIKVKFCKALQLYLAAREGKQRGLMLGQFDPKTLKLQREIVGL